MEKTPLRIKTNKKRFWRLYLELLNPILKLIPREMDVLACLLMIHSSNRERKDIESILLSYDSRVAIRQYVNVSENVINNVICDLKKKGLLIKTEKGYKIRDILVVADGKKNHVIEYNILVDENI